MNKLRTVSVAAALLVAGIPEPLHDCSGSAFRFPQRLRRRLGPRRLGPRGARRRLGRVAAGVVLG